LKIETAQLVIEKLKPVQEKYAELMKNQDYLQTVIKKGAERASAHAERTLARVYDKLGFIAKPR